MRACVCACVCHLSSRFPQAENILMDDVRKNPSPDKLLLLGKIYGHSGKHREAFEAVSATLKSLVSTVWMVPCVLVQCNLLSKYLG